MPTSSSSTSIRPPTHEEGGGAGGLLFIPPPPTGDKGILVEDLAGCLESVLEDVFQNEVLPNVGVAELLSEIHCIAHRAGDATRITPLAPVPADSTPFHSLCVVLKGLISEERDKLWVNISLVKAAQRAAETTPDEAREWTDRLRELQKREEPIFGDCVLGAAHSVYLWRLDPTVRERVDREWKDCLARLHVPFSFTSLPSFLGDPEETPKVVVKTLERFGRKWVSIDDPADLSRKWFQSRGFQRLSLDSGNKAREVVLAAASHGGSLLIEGDLSILSGPVWRPLLELPKTGGKVLVIGDEEATVAPGFKVVFLGDGKGQAGLEGECLLVRWVMGRQGLGEVLVGEVIGAVNPGLEEKYRKAKVGVAKAKEALLEAERAMMKAFTQIGEQPDSKKLRVVKERRAEVLKKLEESVLECQTRRAFYFPVAVRGLTLFRIMAAPSSNFPSLTPPDILGVEALAGEYLTEKEFVQVFREGLKSHLSRPPTFASDEEQVEAAVHALTAVSIRHSELCSPSETAPVGASIQRANTLETRLRSSVEACTLAHNITASVLSRPRARSAALLKAYSLLLQKEIPEEEWQALLLHHPPKEIDEVLLCEQNKRLAALFDAQRRVLLSPPGDGIQAFVEYHERAEQIASRLEGQVQEAADFMALCHWGGAPTAPNRSSTKAP